MSEVIPAQAVEAAAITILDVTPEVWELQDAEVQTEIRIDATRILEAAAPYMPAPAAAAQAMDRILITLTAVAAGQVPQDVAFTVIREISESYTDENEGEK